MSLDPRGTQKKFSVPFDSGDSEYLVLFLARLRVRFIVPSLYFFG